MPKVLGLGNALVDIMTQLPNDGLLETLKLPKGSMQLVDEGFMRKAISFTRDMPQSLSAGGGAANTIHGLANMDVATSFIGKIGDDVFGRAFKTSMEEVGINPIMLKGKAESGRTLALVSTDSERTFAVYLGAALELTAVDLNPKCSKVLTTFMLKATWFKTTKCYYVLWRLLLPKVFRFRSIWPAITLLRRTVIFSTR